MADTKKINDTKIKACIRDIIAENDNDLEYGFTFIILTFDSKITTGLVRKELEKKLKVESGAFSSEKDRISTLLQEVLDQLSAKEEEEPVIEKKPVDKKRKTVEESSASSSNPNRSLKANKTASTKDDGEWTLEVNCFPNQ
jgi:hypothetical protein